MCFVAAYDIHRFVFHKSVTNLGTFFIIQEGQTALHLAAREGHLNVTQVLLDFNAGANSETIVSWWLTLVYLIFIVQLCTFYIHMLDVYMPFCVPVIDMI